MGVSRGRIAAGLLATAALVSPSASATLRVVVAPTDASDIRSVAEQGCSRVLEATGWAHARRRAERAAPTWADVLAPLKGSLPTDVVLVYVAAAGDGESVLWGDRRLPQADMIAALAGIPAVHRLLVLDLTVDRATPLPSGPTPTRWTLESTGEVTAIRVVAPTRAHWAPADLGIPILAHYVQSALRGAADQNGDRATTVGEAVAHLMRGAAFPAEWGGSVRALGATGDAVLTRLPPGSSVLTIRRGPPARLRVYLAGRRDLWATVFRTPDRDVAIRTPGGLHLVLDQPGRARAGIDVWVPSGGEAGVSPADLRRVDARPQARYGRFQNLPLVRRFGVSAGYHVFASGRLSDTGGERVGLGQLGFARFEWEMARSLLLTAGVEAGVTDRFNDYRLEREVTAGAVVGLRVLLDARAGWYQHMMELSLFLRWAGQEQRSVAYVGGQRLDARTTEHGVTFGGRLRLGGRFRLSARWWLEYAVTGGVTGGVRPFDEHVGLEPGFEAGLATRF